MTDWTPPMQEPPADEAAVIDFIRMSAGAFRDPGRLARYKLGPAAVQTAEGLRMAIELQLDLSDQTRVRGRNCAVFALAGHAATTKARYRVDGRVAVDLATLSFMTIDAALVPS